TLSATFCTSLVSAAGRLPLSLPSALSPCPVSRLLRCGAVSASSSSSWLTPAPAPPPRIAPMASAAMTSRPRPLRRVSEVWGAGWVGAANTVVSAPGLWPASAESFAVVDSGGASDGVSGPGGRLSSPPSRCDAALSVDHGAGRPGAEPGGIDHPAPPPLGGGGVGPGG